MAFYTDYSKLVEVDSKKTHWENEFSPGDTVTVSGIYKCTKCLCEITSNEGDPFPPQNSSHNHTGGKWKLNVRTNTKGDNL